MSSRVLGPRLRHPAVLALLQTFGSPDRLAMAGTEQIAQVMLAAAPRMRSAHTLAGQITTALAEQTVTVPGTASAAEIVSGLAEALAVLLKRRDIMETRVAALLETHPLAKVLTSMPGVAVRTGARILAEVGDAGAFPTAAHLASYAGLTPTTRRSQFPSGAKARPAVATSSSNGPCSWPRSPRCVGVHTNVPGRGLYAHRCN
jgi:transposase